MIDINLNGAAPTHVERIKPQISVDNNGNVSWLPGLNDYDASLFYRGKTVTNSEFNELFLKTVYQGNYITDSLTELFQKHLSTAIYRSFTTDFNLIPSYVKSFAPTDWGSLQDDGYYYITIPASEHGFKADEQLTTLDRMNIDTEMYLLGSDGRFYEVTQIDTDTDNTVRIYTDDNTLSGFVVVRTNDKAYALASTETIEASQIRGLAEVATSAKYTDLVDINSATGPNTRIAANLAAINAIVNGDTIVAEATHSEEADLAIRIPYNTGFIGNIAASAIFEPGSYYVKDATRAKDYDTSAGGIKTKFDEIFEALANLEQYSKDTYYKKTDTVINAVNAVNAVTQTLTDSSTKIATTAFVNQYVSSQMEDKMNKWEIVFDRPDNTGQEVYIAPTILSQYAFFRIIIKYRFSTTDPYSAVDLGLFTYSDLVNLGISAIAAGNTGRITYSNGTLTCSNANIRLITVLGMKA